MELKNLNLDCTCSLCSTFLFNESTVLTRELTYKISKLPKLGPNRHYLFKGFLVPRSRSIVQLTNCKSSHCYHYNCLLNFVVEIILKKGKRKQFKCPRFKDCASDFGRKTELKVLVLPKLVDANKVQVNQNSKVLEHLKQIKNEQPKLIKTLCSLLQTQNQMESLLYSLYNIQSDEAYIEDGTTIDCLEILKTFAKMRTITSVKDKDGGNEIKKTRDDGAPRKSKGIQKSNKTKKYSKETRSGHGQYTKRGKKRKSSEESPSGSHSKSKKGKRPGIENGDLKGKNPIVVLDRNKVPDELSKKAVGKKKNSRSRTQMGGQFIDFEAEEDNRGQREKKRKTITSSSEENDYTTKNNKVEIVESQNEEKLEKVDKEEEGNSEEGEKQELAKSEEKDVKGKSSSESSDSGSDKSSSSDSGSSDYDYDSSNSD